MNRLLMHRMSLGLGLCVLLCARICLAQSAPVHRVDMFVDGPLTALIDPHVHVWDLTRPDQVEAAYFPNPLSPNPEQAKAQVAALMNSPQGARFNQTMREAYQGFVEVTRLRVQKIPAIVINQTYVIYGTTDIELALADYREYAQTHRTSMSSMSGVSRERGGQE